MLVVQARCRYTQNPCVGFLLVAGWCFQHFVRNPAQVNTRCKSLTINVMCWPQTWRRAQAGSRLYTDSASSYRALKGYVHEFVNHTQKEYARGDVHENRAECLFSLLKPYLRVFRGLSKINL